LRVLTFTNLFPNSVDRTHGIFIYQRSAFLARRPGNDVAVVAPVPWFPRWLKTRRWQAAAKIATMDEIDGLTVHHPRYFLLPKIWIPAHGLSMAAGCRSLVAKLHKQKPFDCIDAHFVYPDGFAAVLLGKYLGIPVVVSARGTDINLYPSFRLSRPMIRWTLKNAAAVISVSAALRDAICKLGISGGKIHVIANGVDTRRFGFRSVGEARQLLHLPEEGQIVVSVGSLIPSKGHDLIIRAIERVTKKHSAVRLYILGEGPWRRTLEALVKELGLHERVWLIGKRPNEELGSWFSAADVSCLASEREGWPNVVTESLACGTPVVATRVGGVPEILHSRELGILAEAPSESIANGLEEALSKNWDRKAISIQTCKRTWELVAGEVEALLAAQLPEDHAKSA